MFRQLRYLSIAFVAMPLFLACFMPTVQAADNNFDLSNPAWKINAAETALVHANSGMEFPQTLGAFSLEKNNVHDNLGKSVSVTYASQDEYKKVHVKVSIQTEENRSVEQCFRVSTVAFGLRNQNVKPYKTAKIRINVDERGSLPGMAAAYNITDPETDIQKDTRIYMFKLRDNLVKIETSHPMGFTKGGKLIHNDLLKNMHWASILR